MEFYVDTKFNVKTLSPTLGMSLWNIAVANAPMDTGNLRRAITMNRNGEKHKTYTYNALNAVYLHYLEEGMGPVKKHKGFISQMTMGDMIQEIIYYFKTGGKVLASTTPPSVTLSESKQGLMFYEKKLAKALQWSDSSLTADDRRKLSQIRYRGLVGSNATRISGEKISTKYSYKRSKNQKTDVFFMDTPIYEEKNTLALQLMNRR